MDTIEPGGIAADSPYKIEKGVPIPPLPGARPKYPWAEMEIGDSLLIPAGTLTKHSARQIASTQNVKYAPKRFMSRTVAGGLRVWRIA